MDPSTRVEITLGSNINLSNSNQITKMKSTLQIFTFDVVGALDESLIQGARLLGLDMDQRHMAMEAVLYGVLPPSATARHRAQAHSSSLQRASISPTQAWSPSSWFGVPPSRIIVVPIVVATYGSCWRSVREAD